MKSVLFVSGFILAALVLECLRKAYGIPLTILDLFLFPLSLIFTYVLLRDFFFQQSRERKEMTEPLSVRARLGRAAASLLLFLPLGLWSLWEGIRNPFGYFSGVKGAAHGYTLIGIGLFVLSIAVMLGVSVFRSLTAKSEN